MKKIVFINACIRRKKPRTLVIARSLLSSLAERYVIHEIDLTNRQLSPVTAELFGERGLIGISKEDKREGELVANADGIVIAAPFWDMSFPAVLKTFFEHISVAGLTFSNNDDGTTRGNCKAEKILYITTRGMNISTDSPLDQGTPYLRALGWLWGIPQVCTVAAHGMDVEREEVVSSRLAEAITSGLKICKEF